MIKLQIISIFLLLLSLLGDWGTGYDRPFLLQLFSPSTKNIASEFVNETILQARTMLLFFIASFVFLIFIIFKSKKSKYFSFVGVVFSIFNILYASWFTYVSYSLQGFPSGGNKDISALGYGPPLAILSLLILLFTFFRRIFQPAEEAKLNTAGGELKE